MNIWLWHNDAATGPFTEEAVRRGVEQGEIDRNLLARAGEGQWKTIAEILNQPSRSDIPIERRPALVSRDFLMLAGCIGGAFFVVALAFNLLLARSNGASDGKPPATQQQVYDFAVGYLRDEVVGVQAVGDFSKSRVIQNTSNTWSVEIRADGLNAFGGPARNLVVVDVRESDGYLFGERFSRKSP